MGTKIDELKAKWEAAEAARKAGTGAANDAAQAWNAWSDAVRAAGLGPKSRGGFASRAGQRQAAARKVRR